MHSCIDCSQSPCVSLQHKMLQHETLHIFCISIKECHAVCSPNLVGPSLSSGTWCESMRPPSGTGGAVSGVLYLDAGAGFGAGLAGAGAAFRTGALALVGDDDLPLSQKYFAIISGIHPQHRCHGFASAMHRQAHQVDPKGTPYCMHS